jgi:hypothetical protein
VSARVQEVTRAQGGFVAASTVTSTPEGGEGTFDLRIPTRNLDAALASLARLGKVRDRAQSARDITAKSVSTRDTLADARAERRSLLRQLGAAVTLAQTESLRARLRLVSAEIRRARAAVRRVDNRAAYSTVGVTLVSDYTGTGTTEEGRRVVARTPRATPCACWRWWQAWRWSRWPSPCRSACSRCWGC